MKTFLAYQCANQLVQGKDSQAQYSIILIKQKEIMKISHFLHLIEMNLLIL